MRITYRTDKMDLTVDGADTKAAFDELAKALEIFGQTRCGACDSTDVTFRTRVAQGNTYREAHCLECRSSLTFGLTKADLTMFPRRKTKSGEWIDNNGWVKYQPQGGDEPF
jgi:hypothetical protein